MDRWRGKVAIVTGASQGVGAAVASALVKEGLQVVGLARQVEKIEALAESLSGEPGKLYAVKTDITNEEEILDAFAWILRNLGPISILINNAGFYKPTGLTDGETSIWKHTLDVNVLGLCITTREAVSSMIKCGIDGHIIHISSVTARVVPEFPEVNVYPGSKAAIESLTEVLRKDLNRMGSKIKVSCIAPGVIATELATKVDALGEIAKCPHLQPEDIANAIIYVLSTPPNVQIAHLTIKPIGEQI